MKKIGVIIPCYNEENGICKVIESIPKSRLRALGYDTDIIVIDNNSKDRTAEAARSCGARVLTEMTQGKGHAVLKGFRSLDADTEIIVMLDGDNTYLGEEMLRLIEPIESGFCDVVIGSRLSGKIMKGSMPYFNRVGNWFLTFLVRLFYISNVTDVCTGYFAWRRHVVDSLAKCISSDGFTLEMEMIVKMARMNYDIVSVPITYEVRQGMSSLDPVKAGAAILYTWASHLFWRPEEALIEAPSALTTES